MRETEKKKSIITSSPCCARIGTPRSFLSHIPFLDNYIFFPIILQPCRFTRSLFFFFCFYFFTSCGRVVSASKTYFLHPWRSFTTSMTSREEKKNCNSSCGARTGHLSSEGGFLGCFNVLYMLLYNTSRVHQLFKNILMALYWRYDSALANNNVLKLEVEKEKFNNPYSYISRIFFLSLFSPTCSNF